MTYLGTANFNWTAGTLQISGSVEIGGALTNAGGTLEPYYEDENRTTSNEVGVVEILGGYNVTSANAILAIDANGATTAGVDYDQVITGVSQLVIGGTVQATYPGHVTLNGSLAVDLGYAPATGTAGDVLKIIDVENTTPGTTSGTLNGAAEGTEIAVDDYGNHQFWAKITYAGAGSGEGVNDVELYQFRRLLLGDATGPSAVPDGIVDMIDYQAWFNNYGTTGNGWNQANFDLDASGLVDMVDYTIWFNHYGLTGGGGSESVPEPATMGLLVLGAAALLRRRRS
jgi:hypothetical protein